MWAVCGASSTFSGFLLTGTWIAIDESASPSSTDPGHGNGEAARMKKRRRRGGEGDMEQAQETRDKESKGKIRRWLYHQTAIGCQGKTWVCHVGNIHVLPGIDVDVMHWCLVLCRLVFCIHRLDRLDRVPDSTEQLPRCWIPTTRQTCKDVQVVAPVKARAAEMSDHASKLVWPNC